MIFLLIIPMLVHLLHDTAVKKINHVFSASLTAVTALILGVIACHWQKGVYWWQFWIFAMCIHFCFFDPIWNLVHKESWDYHGDPENPNRALTDRMWSRIPPVGEILFRLIILGVGWGVYYHLNWIINGYNG